MKESMTYLWLVAAELSVRVRQSLQTDGELDITTPDDVLNLEFEKLGIEAELLNDPSILPRRQPRVILRLGTSDDHLPRSENQSSSLGITDTHDHSCETL